MAITASDIHNQKFSVDRKGYDVDEVDVFMEHVADEIDALNAQINDLESQLDSDRFSGFDRPARTEEPAADAAALVEKDERIAELEAQLEARRADDNVIAQALIVAQRSGDKIVADSKVEAAATVKDAEEEAERILNKAEADKQKVLDAIKQLEEDRENAREQYKNLLTDFIGDATRKLSDIGEDAPKAAPEPDVSRSAHAAPAAPASAPAAAPAEPAPERSAAQAPIRREGTGYYTTPQATGEVVAAATPVPSSVEKDFSGFGDTDVDFDFSELD